METIQISEIIQTNRTRADLGELGALAESIRRHGLLQPIVIDANNELRCGSRRLAAVKLLCWKEVPIVRLEYLSPLEQLEIELDENSRRKDFTWQEELTLRVRIIKLYQEKDQSIERIGERLNLEPRTLYRSLLVANAIEKNPNLLKEESFMSALSQAERMNQNQLRTLAVQAMGPLTKLETANQVENISVGSLKQDSTTNNRTTIYKGDCRNILKSIPTESIDLILTDPPFGVDYNYDTDSFVDSKEYVLTDLLPVVLTECYRILKPGAPLYMLYPIVHHSVITAQVLLAGLRLHYVPLIWDKQLGPANHRFYGMDYEPILLAYKPPTMRPLQEPARCMFRVPTVTGQRIHPTERPVELLMQIIKLATISGETILDPFAGSGSTAIAALRLDRNCITIEQDENFYKIASLRLLEEGANVEETG